jgi:hypothetical protein
VELKTKQDYNKVGGWLKFFGIIAGLAFLLHCLIYVVYQDRWFEVMRRTNTKDAGFIELAQAFSLLALPFIALAQCVCIFQRRRLGRTLSLVFYGYITLFNLIFNVLNFRQRDSSSETMILFLAAIIGVAMHAVPVAYFLISERVEKTLVN